MNERLAHRDPKLLSLLAHDLRGSIAVIVGALDEAGRALGPEGEAALPFLRMATRGAMRSLRIADDLQHNAELELAIRVEQQVECVVQALPMDPALAAALAGRCR